MTFWCLKFSKKPMQKFDEFLPWNLKSGWITKINTNCPLLCFNNFNSKKAPNHYLWAAWHIWYLFFQFNQFLDSRAEIHQTFVLVFETSKSHSEVNWPLVTDWIRNFNDDIKKHFGISLIPFADTDIELRRLIFLIIVLFFPFIVIVYRPLGKNPRIQNGCLRLESPLKNFNWQLFTMVCFATGRIHI